MVGGEADEFYGQLTWGSRAASLGDSVGVDDFDVVEAGAAEFAVVEAGEIVGEELVEALGDRHRGDAEGVVNLHEVGDAVDGGVGLFKDDDGMAGGGGVLADAFP